ncbi:DUF2937 family protein [Fontimonas sp. SYSU GA230001]|uniref:DUF2937 family protein n=1 Tax=Fontimonas sp. SYSU GA230001 TaxID=3142450 RepID=UPI0032B5B4EF
MRLITGLLDRLLFAAGLALFLQIPQFIDHYTQRYGGYRQALADSVAQYQQNADRHYRGDLDAMTRDFRNDDKPALRDIGDKIADERRRLAEMEHGLAILRYGHLGQKLWYLARHIEPSIAYGVLENFRPGLPLTIDALLCGLVGGVLASALFNLLLWPLRLVVDRRPLLRV